LIFNEDSQLEKAMNRFSFLGCVLLVMGLGWFSVANALTIFRIGGENLPRPDVSGDVEFVQLSWNEAEEARHGSLELLEASPDYIKPRELDPSVNLTPSLESSGGQILALGWTGWERRLEEDLVFFDEDPSTAYTSSETFDL
jgi:hypothetical protein